MLRAFLIALGLIALAACTDFPKDPESTLQRVKAERTFRVGLIASAASTVSDPAVQAFLRSVSKSAQASPQVTQGEAEVLLPRLEQGELDLVIGRFEKRSPWSSLVTLGPPLRKERAGKTEWQVVPVMRNGENAWIALVEREARNVSPGGR